MIIGEGIALIPFIEEEEFLNAFHSIIESEMSEEEARRNALQPPRIFSYDTRVTETLLPTLASLRILKNIQVADELISTPDPKEFVFQLHKEARLGAQMEPHFPSFFHLKYIKSCEKLRTQNAFGQKGRFYTMGIKVYYDQNDMEVDEGDIDPLESDSINQRRIKLFSSVGLDEELADPVAVAQSKRMIELISKQIADEIWRGNGRVYIDWPFMIEALVEAVICETKTFTKDGREIENSIDDIEKFGSEFQKLEGQYFLKGVEISSKIALKVRKLQSMEEKSTGARSKVYSSDLFYYPYVLSTTNIANSDPRLIERDNMFKDLQSFAPIGTPVIITAGDHAGAVGQVSKFELRALKVSYNMPPRVEFKFEEEEYIREQDLSKQFDLSLDVFYALLRNIYIEYNREVYNVGLQLKFSNPKMNSAAVKAIGYSRMIVSGGNYFQWEYTNAAVELINNYIDVFSPVLEYAASLRDRIRGNLNLADIFPELSVDEIEERLQEYVKFVKENIDPIQRISVNSESLLYPTKNISYIVETLQSYFEKNTSSDEHYTYENDLVPLHQLMFPKKDFYQPEKKSSDVNTFLELGDRVVYVRDNAGSFGSYATVVYVDYEKLTASLLFDKEFFGGVNFNIPFVFYSFFFNIS